jgi:TrmH family RNA methyltransferase
MSRPEVISSPANPLLKDVRRAIARGGLTQQGLCVAETFHLLEEALRSDRGVPVVLVAESVRSTVEKHVRGLASVRVVVLDDTLFQNLAGTESSQGVIALVEAPAWKLEQLLRGATLLIVLDGVQDPGNAGAIVRAAEAFGATGVMFLKGTASPFNPKTLRASAGSLFRVPFVHGLDPALGAAALKQAKLDIYAGVTGNGSGVAKKIGDVDLRRHSAIIIGSEGRGVRAAMRAGAIDLTIPTVSVESLNAAMAATVILYEAHRQRSRAV